MQASLNYLPFVFGNNAVFRKILHLCPSPVWACVSKSLSKLVCSIVTSGWDVYVRPLQEELHKILLFLNQRQEHNICPRPMKVTLVNRPSCNPHVNCTIATDGTLDWVLARMILATPPSDPTGSCLLPSVGMGMRSSIPFPKSESGKKYRIVAGRSFKSVDEIAHLLHIVTKTTRDAVLIRGMVVPLISGLVPNGMRTASFSGETVRRSAFWLWKQLIRSLRFFRACVPSTVEDTASVRPAIANPFRFRSPSVSLPVYMAVGCKREKCFDIRLRSLKMFYVNENNLFGCNLRDVVRRRLRSMQIFKGLCCYMSNGRMKTHAHELLLESGGDQSILGRSGSFSEVYRGSFRHGHSSRVIDTEICPQMLHAACVTGSLRFVLRMRAPGAPRVLPHALMRTPGSDTNAWDREMYLDHASTDHKYNRRVVGGVPCLDRIGVHMRVLASSPLRVTSKLRRAKPQTPLRIATTKFPASALPWTLLGQRASQWLLDQPWLPSLTGRVGMRAVDRAWVKRCLCDVAMTPCKVICGVAVLSVAMSGPDGTPAVVWEDRSKPPRFRSGWWGERDPADALRRTLEDVSLLWFRIMTVDLAPAIRIVQVRIPDTAEMFPDVTLSSAPVETQRQLEEHVHLRLSVLWCECASWFVRDKACASTEAFNSVLKAYWDSAFSEKVSDAFLSNFGLADGHLVQVFDEDENSYLTVTNPSICCSPARHHMPLARHARCHRHTLDDKRHNRRQLRGGAMLLGEVLADHGARSAVGFRLFNLKVVPSVRVRFGG